MSQNYKELQREWYQKLKETGFKDIEQNKIQKADVQARYLDGTNGLKRICVERFQIRQRYYELAGQFLHDFKFKTRQEKEIWNLHSEGMPMRAIAKNLSMRTCQIFLVIKRHKKKMLNDR